MVIPSHKRFVDLDSIEKVSLARVVKILARHPISFVGPDSVDRSEFVTYANDRAVKATSVSFPREYFDSYAGYNRLLVDSAFYRSFQQHSHILIYQLDAYVFDDRLEKWCRAGFDYVGAPWIGDRSGTEQSGPMTGVGNGGFSLRNVETALRVLTSERPMKPFNRLLAERRGRRRVRSVLGALAGSLLGRNNSGHYWASSHMGSEDAFWGDVVRLSRYEFRLPDPGTAATFSFEVAPRQLFELTGQKLPFGCHNWFRYDPQFWKPFIEW